MRSKHRLKPLLRAASTVGNQLPHHQAPRRASAPLRNMITAAESYLPRPKPTCCAANHLLVAALQYQSVAILPRGDLPLIHPGMCALSASQDNSSVRPAAPTCRPKSNSTIFLWFCAQRQAEYQVPALNTVRYGLNQGTRVPKTASAQNFGHIRLVME